MKRPYREVPFLENSDEEPLMSYKQECDGINYVVSYNIGTRQTGVKGRSVQSLVDIY